MKVSNLKSSKGNNVPNQFEITGALHVRILFDKPQEDLKDMAYCRTKEEEHQYTGSGRLFQSYDSLVCFVNHTGNIFIDERYYKYSNTTSRYLSVFLERDSKEIAKDIKSGDIRLCEIVQ